MRYSYPFHQRHFTGENLVATESGQVRIDEIELGDKVWAYNVETGETELKTVTKIYVHEVDEILHLYTSEGQIDTTTNHPFYVVDKGWVAAGDLKAGDKILKLNGTVAVVTGSKLEKLDESILVYNLEVEDFHTYFVGNEPVLVHNYQEGTGEYGDVGGHHVHAKSGFAGDVNYDPKKGFSISQEFMETNGLNHQKMTSKQRELFKELYESGRPNTLEEHTRIAREALKAGGASDSLIDQLIKDSLDNLSGQGVTQPTRIPWYSK